jgi:hypothetical protein
MYRWSGSAQLDWGVRRRWWCFGSKGAPEAQRDCLSAVAALQWRMPRDPFIREKFTRERSAARNVAAEYFQRFPKDMYRTEVESWRNLHRPISNSP